MFATYRIQITYDKAFKKPLKKSCGVFYFWHQNIISGLFFFFTTKSTGHCIVSPSSDGKIAGFICQKLGFSVLYGSSHKAPINLVRNALNILKKDKRICIIGDGSRGPAFKLKKGITYMAEKTNLPIVFVESKPSHAITFKKSWDKFQIPLPFSKISIHVHAPKKPYSS